MGSRMKRYVLDACVILVLAAAVLFYLNASSANEKPPREISAPLVALDEDGNETTIYSRSDSTSILVLFFQADCWACVKEYPSWLAVVAEAKEGGIEVVGVSTQRTVTVPRELQNLPVYTVGSLPELNHSLPVIGVPTTVLLGPQGRVAFYHRGIMPEEKTSELRSILATVER